MTQKDKICENQFNQFNLCSLVFLSSLHPGREAFVK